jgi:hypothetical protein
MIRILVCGEGSHDVGKKEWNPHLRSHEFLDGWLQCVIRSHFAQEIEFIACTRKELIRLPRREYKPLPRGHGAKALAARFMGEVNKCHFVVYMVDADSPDSARWSEIRVEILDGFSKFSDSGGIACVPMSASESWLLADDVAWSEVGLDDVSILPRFPEKIWGIYNDPNGNRPHDFFSRVCVASGLPDNRETRVRIAQVTNLSKLRLKCPVSFQAFAQDLSESLNSE